MGRNRAKSRFAGAPGVALAAILVLLNVLGSVHLVSMDLGFYRVLWERYGVSEATGMQPSELDRAGTALTGYFVGRTTTPQIQTRIFGQARPLYNETELTHLEDVQALFKMGLTAERALAVAAVVGAIFMVLDRKRKALGTSLLVAGILGVALLLLLAIPAVVDFGGFWTNFHLAAFSNDLWLLDPNTDWLIRMFPEEFFFSTVERIGMYSAGISLLLVVLGLSVRRFSTDRRH